MPSIAISELVTEADARQNQNGLSATRAFLVTGLTSTTGPMLQAMLTDGIPQYGEQHPDFPLIYVIDVHPTPFLKSSKTEARVVVTYGPPTGNNLANTHTELSGFTRETRTNFDTEGQVIKVFYAADQGPGGTSNPEVGLVTGYKSLRVKVFEFITIDDPTTLSQFTNAVNDNTWADGAPYTWRIDRVEVAKAQFIAGYRVRVIAVYDPETWLKVAMWRDIHGHIPADIETPITMEPGAVGNGWHVVLPRGLFLATLPDFPHSF
jgi:hypothetical protein